jgi:hypothetical protein
MGETMPGPSGNRTENLMMWIAAQLMLRRELLALLA